jgi:hypothetical protein
MFLLSLFFSKKPKIEISNQLQKQIKKKVKKSKKR